MSEKVTNLTFHGIGPPPSHLDTLEKEFWVRPETFLFVLDQVKDRKDIRITFDDGNLSDYVHAFPALCERGMTADFFVCVGLLGTDGFLDQDKVEEMSQHGMRFGSHGFDHCSWRRLSDKQLKREIIESKAALEDRLGSSVESAACPFGDYDSRVLRKLKEADYRRVFTSDKGRAWSDHWLQSRNALRSWHSTDQILRVISPSPPPLIEWGKKLKTFLKKRR